MRTRACLLLSLAACGSRVTSRPEPVTPATPPGAPISVAQRAASPEAPQPDLGDEVFRVTVDDAPTQGPPDALVTIVIFGDYTSRATRSSDRVLRDLAASRRDVRYVWKHAPVPRGESQRLAALADAAVTTGRFWELHDALLSIDPRDAAALRRAALLGRVKGAGTARAGELPERVRADRRQARELGVSVQPAIFINGRLLRRAVSVERLVELVEEAAEDSTRLRRAGVAPREVYARLTADGRLPGAPLVPQGLVVQGLAVGPDEARRAVDPGRGPSLGGSRAAPVQIVWFGDLRDPFTARQAANLTALAAARPEDVRVTWRHLPLALHGDAELAHRAATAAGAQGAFWPYARRVLALRDELDRPRALRLAAEAGLDLRRFTRDLDDPATADAVTADADYGRELVANLVPPTLFINGTRITVAPPLAVLEELVDDALRDGGPR